MATIAPADVAGVLAEIATATPQGRHPDVAGPEPQDRPGVPTRHAAVR
ncbi:hypothetical protein [Actinoallomurus acaciae]|uniref:Uncharacterized protein n=1 Tax=Actinoallomurus acaciae TaxID=502577 RepID=A0ABV5YK27_9ACTN